jgi:sulfur transfer protein SufE
MKAAWLQLKKSKDKIFPTKVGFLKAADGTTVNGVVFYFLKKGAGGEPTIAPDEKEIDFYLKIGDAKLLTAFDPRKMVDSQGEDL